MISTEKDGKVTERGKFTCAVCGKGVGSNSPVSFAGVGCMRNIAVLEVN